MIFSVRQLQEKCNKQNTSLYIAFIDLTKAFDLVSLKGLFTILLKVGCYANLFNVKKFFTQTQGQPSKNDCSVSYLFEIKSWIKQGCVLSQTLFEIFYQKLLKHPFGSSTTSIKLHTIIIT